MIGELEHSVNCSKRNKRLVVWYSWCVEDVVMIMSACEVERK